MNPLKCHFDKFVYIFVSLAVYQLASVRSTQYAKRDVGTLARDPEGRGVLCEG